MRLHAAVGVPYPSDGGAREAAPVTSKTIEGGPNRLAKQHEQGKLTARERIEAIIDPSSQQAAPSAASPAQPASGSPTDESKVCRSPIAGVVVKVSSQVGQSIQANDVLIVLEAMKMETTITSPAAGKIAKMNAALGDPVKGGQILVEFE